MNLLICFALKEEAAPFRKFAAGKSGISILITGIGRGRTLAPPPEHRIHPAATRAVYPTAG